MQPVTVTPVSPTGAIDLIGQVFSHLRMIEDFLDQPIENLRLPIAEHAIRIAASLSIRVDDPHSERLARRMCQLMWPIDQTDPPAAFWGTDLGSDIAWHIGYPKDDVPIWAAAAVLRVNRVTIWRICQGPITATRLRELARSRATTSV
jgi:hypothetical protein